LKSNRKSRNQVGSSHVSRFAGGTQNEWKPVLRISGPQLLRAIRGAQPGNRNAVKALEWLSSYDLSTPTGLDAFMQEVIRRVWTGELGTRAGSTINGSLKLLLEHQALPALEKRIEQLESAQKVRPTRQ
jgi:hypothetical protein